MLHKNTRLYFYFIRHGEYDGQHYHHKLTGTHSFRAHLNERGVAQAKALGLRFKDKGIRFDRVYTSTMYRAIETTEVMCREIMRTTEDIIHVNDLIGFSQGEWKGRPRAEVYTPENLAYMNSKGSWFAPPGGESQRMIERRATLWLEDAILFNSEVLNASMPLHIAVVTHGCVITCLLHYIMGFDDRLIWRIQLDNCSITKFLFKKDGWFPLASTTVTIFARLVYRSNGSCANEAAHKRHVLWSWILVQNRNFRSFVWFLPTKNDV